MKNILANTLISITAISLFSAVTLCQSVDNDNVDEYNNNTDTRISSRGDVKSYDDGKNPPIDIKIDVFNKRDCKGAAQRMMSKLTYGTNYDAPDTASFYLHRDLQNNEQLDFKTNADGSIKRGLSSEARSGTPNTLEERYDNPHCAKFLFSAPIGQTQGCYNLRTTVDCWRLWENPEFAPVKGS